MLKKSLSIKLLLISSLFIFSACNGNPADNTNAGNQECNSLTKLTQSETEVFEQAEKLLREKHNNNNLNILLNENGKLCHEGGERFRLNSEVENITEPDNKFSIELIIQKNNSAYSIVSDNFSEEPTNIETRFGNIEKITLKNICSFCAGQREETIEIVPYKLNFRSHTDIESDNIDKSADITEVVWNELIRTMVAIDFSAVPEDVSPPKDTLETDGPFYTLTVIGDKGDKTLNYYIRVDDKYESVEEFSSMVLQVKKDILPDN